MKKFKLLVVEDDKSLQDLYDLALNDGHFEKEFADTGKRAMELYAAWNPDVILLDIMMPDIAGHEILKKIREDFDDHSTKVLIVSSIDGKGEVAFCKRLGIQGYIVKPFDHKKLAAQVLDCCIKEGAELDGPS